jgi:MFS family permease
VTLEAKPALTASPGSIFTGPLRTTSGGILILITLVAFEAMAVSAALPTAARDLHGLGGYGWAFTGFLVANVVGMVVSGQISDSRGPRGPLIAGMACFIGGLVLAGTAVAMAQLVAGRFVQGLGSGLLITATYVVIGQTYPEALRPKLFAAISSAWVLPALIGPVISGTLAQHASWRWVFLGLVPFTVIGAVLMMPVLRTLHTKSEARIPVADRFRILHAFAVAGGIAALESAGQHPSVLSVALAVVGVVALGWGLHTLLPAGTFQMRRGVAAAVGARGLLAGAFFGIESMIPLSMTVQHGYSATAAGLPLACSGLTWTLGSWWQGRTVHADDPEYRVRLVRAGFGFVLFTAVAVAVAEQPAVPGWVIYPAWAFAGLGAGLTMTSASVLLLKFTNDRDRGADSAALQLSDATASAVTTGVAGVLVAAAARATLGYTAAFTILDVAMAGVALVGVLVAGQMRAPVPAE